MDYWEWMRQGFTWIRILLLSCALTRDVHTVFAGIRVLEERNVHFGVNILYTRVRAISDEWQQ